MCLTNKDFLYLLRKTLRESYRKIPLFTFPHFPVCQSLK